MRTMPASDLNKKMGDVRRGLIADGAVRLTWRGTPWARVVPEDYVTNLEAEVARLQARLAAYEKRPEVAA